MDAQAVATRLGIDHDGFVASDALARFVQQYGWEEVGVEDLPALWIEDVPETQGTTGEDLHYRRTLESQRAMQTLSGGNAQRYLNKVAFLLKRPGGLFPHMITIGRASNSDLVLALADVSKVQAYFMKSGDQWQIVDQRSHNGTYLGPQRLEPTQPTPLDSNSVLRFGESLTLRFLSSQDLRARLEQ